MFAQLFSKEITTTRLVLMQFVGSNCVQMAVFQTYWGIKLPTPSELKA